MKKIIYFPRWFWPNNLGDSCVFSYIPRIIKNLYPNCSIEVVTFGGLIPLIKKDPNVNLCREPNEQELKIPVEVWKYYAFNNNIDTNNFVVLYPENHPQLFSHMKENWSLFLKNNNVNYILLNYLLQLKLDNLLKFCQFDLSVYEGMFRKVEKNKTTIKLGFAPMLKTNGKPTPHPGCDGIGYRFNGSKGLDSWKRCLDKIKNNNPNVKTYEFSHENLNLGDYHIGIKSDLYSLLEEVNKLDFGLTTDGGYHHLFNLINLPLVLFTGTKVTKPEFMKLKNSYYPEDLHLECRKNCSSFYFEVFGGEDKSKFCKLECENLDPIKLANYTSDIITKLFYDKNNLI